MERQGDSLVYVTAIVIVVIARTNKGKSMTERGVYKRREKGGRGAENHGRGKMGISNSQVDLDEEGDSKNGIKVAK
jgi:hypothetical protein